MVDRGWGTLWVWVVLAAFAPAAQASPCPTLDAEIDLVTRTGGDILLRIAPWLGSRGAPGLLARADKGDAQAILALGLTGQADALKVLRDRRFPTGTGTARSLALLALGDASETSTVTHALEASEPGQRARYVAYVASFRTMRSYELLEKALSDPDATVRFEAARPLAKVRHPRAHRVLLEIARTGPEALRAPATQAASTAPPPTLEDQLDDDEPVPAPVKGKDKSKDAGLAPPVPVLEAARAHLKGKDGDALRAALQLFGESAQRSEVDILLEVARRPDISLDTRAIALESALKMCPY